jgi:HD-GYP domain-containing protein (c-di-GMP phosphodiesterase class II)
MRKLSERRLVLIGSSSVGIGATFTFIGVIIPLFLSLFTESKSAIGIIIGLGALVGMVVFPLAASYSDKISTPIGKRTPFILTGIIITIFSLLLGGQSTKLISIIFYLVGVWIGINLIVGPMLPLVSDIVAVDQRGKAFAFSTFFWIIGALLINSVGAILYGVNRSFIFYFVALLLLLTGSIVLNIKEPHWSIEFKKGVRNRYIEKIRFKMKLRVHLEELLVEKEPIKFIVLMFLCTFGMGLILPFIPLFFKDVLNVPDSKIPLLFAIPLLIGLPATIAFGHLVDKFDAKRFFYFSAVFQIFIIAGFAFVKNVTQAIGLMIFGALFSGSSVLEETVFSNIIPSSQKGEFWGLKNIFTNIAWFIAPPLGGLLIDSFNYRVVFLIVALFMGSLTFLIRFVNMSGYTFDAIARLIDSLASKDRYSRRHYRESSILAKKIGQKLNLEEKQLQILETAGFLYDIGKIKIPKFILTKEGPLTDEGRDILRSHTIHARDIILRYRKLDDIAEVVYYHHERWDGKGYPAGLKGNEIPLLSRILAVVDAYRAMISDRPYRKALSVEQARKELIKNAGTQFDPAVVDAFLKLEDKEEKVEIVQEKLIESGLERRRYPRVQADFGIKYRIKGERADFKGGKSVNISECGIMFVCSENLVQEGTLELRIQLPASYGSIKTKGRICYITDDSTPEKKSYRCGVAFQRLSKEDQNKIKQFVEDTIYSLELNK